MISVLSVKAFIVGLALCAVVEAGTHKQQPQGGEHGHGLTDPSGSWAAAPRGGYGGYGGGWGGDYALQTIIFVGLPLLIIPLLFLWPYLLHGGGHGGGHGWGHGGGHAGGGGGGHHGGYARTQSDTISRKTDQLTQQILPKL